MPIARLCARFLREARTLQVPQPNLIQVRAFGKDAEMVYVVTDLLQGCSLEELLARGRLPLDQVTAFVAQVLAHRGAASARWAHLWAASRHHSSRRRRRRGRASWLGPVPGPRSSRD